MKNKTFSKKRVWIIVIALFGILLLVTRASSGSNGYNIPIPEGGKIVFFNDNTGENLFSINHNGEFTWSVGTSQGEGVLSTESYDSENNQTLIWVNGGNFTEAGIEDATTINASGELFYVNSVINDTHLYGLGELAFSGISNWTYKINAYFDIAGTDTDERGYSVSKDGLWQWSLYSPSSKYSNENNFCLASRNNSFADLMCAKQEGIIEYYSPIQLSTTFDKPNCNELTRGALYYLRGEAGQDDKLQVCTKNSTEDYGWRNSSLI
jgi:hypothetical protein